MKIIKVLIFLLLFVSLAYAEDKTIDKLLNKAVNNDYKLKSLHHQKKAKKYQEEQARAKYKPSVSFSSYLGWQEYKPYYGGKTDQTLQYYYLALKQPVFHPEVLQAIRKSKLYTKVADLQMKQEEQYIKYLFFSSLTDYTYSLQLEKLYKERLNLYKKKYLLANELFRENRLTKPQLLSIEDSYKQAFIDYKNAQFEKQQFEKTLKIITGEENLPELTFNPNFQFDNLNQPFDNWKEKLKNSYQLKEAKINVEIAKKEIKIRRYQRYPKVDLEVSYRYSSTSAVSVASDDKRIALIIDFPLYQGGLISASVMEAKELEKAAIMDYKQLERENLLQLKDSYSQLTKNINNIKEELKKINLLNDKLSSVKIALESKALSKSYLIDTKIQIIEEKIRLLNYKKLVFAEYIKMLYTISGINGKYENLLKKFFSGGQNGKNNN